VRMQQKTQEIFVRYSGGVETIPDNEAAISDEIVATLLDIAKKVGERQRHTVRAVHAKSNGLVKVEGAVLPDLREELRQGLFAKPASYNAVMRFSSEPGDVLSDHTSTPRRVQKTQKSSRCSIKMLLLISGYYPLRRIISTKSDGR